MAKYVLIGTVVNPAQMMGCPYCTSSLSSETGLGYGTLSLTDGATAAAAAISTITITTRRNNCYRMMPWSHLTPAGSPRMQPCMMQHLVLHQQQHSILPKSSVRLLLYLFKYTWLLCHPLVIFHVGIYIHPWAELAMGIIKTLSSNWHFVYCIHSEQQYATLLNHATSYQKL